jgi:hypothetical protein
MNPKSEPIAWTLALAAVLSLAASRPCAAGPVTKLADDGSPGTPRCELSHAMAGNAISFAVTGTNKLTNSELVIDRNLTISGPGYANLTKTLLVNPPRATGFVA